MEIVYSAHAVERMRLRNIGPSEVEKVLQKSDGEIKQSKGKSIFYKRLRKRKDNLVAVVALKDGPLKYEIITIMIIFEVKK